MDLTMSHKRQNSTFLFTILLFSDTKNKRFEITVLIYMLLSLPTFYGISLILDLCMKLALSCENKIISQQNNDQNQLALVVCKF